MMFSKTQNRCKLRLRLRLDLRPSVKLGQGQYCLSYLRLLFLWSNPNELTLIRYTEFINVYYKIGITTYLQRSTGDHDGGVLCIFAFSGRSVGRYNRAACYYGGVRVRDGNERECTHIGYCPILFIYYFMVSI